MRELERLKCVQGVVDGHLRLSVSYAPSVAPLDRFVHALATEFGRCISAEQGIWASKLE
jgi:hypothetical protein